MQLLAITYTRHHHLIASKIVQTNRTSNIENLGKGKSHLERLVKLKFYLGFLVLPLLLFCILTFPHIAHATLATQKIWFSDLSDFDGLTQNTVNDIIQDKEGYMWVSTMGGLHKFDGVKFTRMQLTGHKNYLLSPIPSAKQVNHIVEPQIIAAIMEDSRQRLWVGTATGRVFHIDKFTGIVTEVSFALNENVFDIVANPKPDTFGGLITTIVEDKQGKIWLGATQGLAVYDPQDDSFTVNPPIKFGPDLWRNVTDIVENDRGQLWVGTGNGLYLLDPESRKINTQYLPDKQQPNGLSSAGISSLYLDDDALWIGTFGGGLQKLSLSGTQFITYKNDIYQSDSLGSDMVQDILRDSANRLWITTQGGGMSLFQPQTNNFRRFNKSKNNPHGFTNNSAWCLFEDKSGVLWIGYAGSGIGQLVPSSRKFSVLKSVAYNDNTISDNFIWQFALEEQSNHEILWIATLDGLNRYDTANQTNQVFYHNKPIGNEIRNNELISLDNGVDDSLIVGTPFGELLHFDLKTFQFTPFIQPRFGNRFSSGRMWNVHQDKRDNIWITTPEGTYRLTPDQQRQALKGPVDFEPFTTDIVRTIYQDRLGRYWMGLQGLGVKVYAADLTLLKQMIYDPKKDNSLSSNVVRSFGEDSSGDIWIGTNSGLNKMIRPNNAVLVDKFQNFYTTDGLINDTIYSIVREQDSLWLATNAGLSKLNSKTGHFENYDRSNGIAANEFNGGAAQIAKDGTIYLGGVNGVTYFRSGSMIKNNMPPALAISQFRINDEIVGNPFSMIGVEEVVLKHHQNDLSFEISALDYHQPKLNKVRYRLFPFETEWEQGSAGEVKYSHLHSGEYVFELKGSNNDGVWSEHVKSIRIVIRPPWWEHPFSYTLYFLTIVLLVLAYRRSTEQKRKYLQQMVRLRTSDLGMANKELADTIAELEDATEAAEHANELKSSFLANMSHEIRTPLTAIIGFTEHAINADKDEEQRKGYLQRVLRSGQHLLHLINEILDLSKIEADKLELEDRPVKLFELMADIESYCHATAQEKGVKFKVLYQYPLPEEINGDLFRIRQVLYNLCSNALKFTDEGKVSILVRHLPRNHQIHFSIQDTGIGMSKDELKRLFQPFVQADSSITRVFGGSGLGLVISQKLVNIMGGEIIVESTKGVGSHFDIFLPANNDSPKLLSEAPEIQLQDDSVQATSIKYPDVKILVAEDNPDNQELVRLLLAPYELDLTVVDNGGQAVEAVLLDNFDLIFMDIQMPTMGGVEAVQLMRNAGIGCPIIALTANVMKEDIDTYLQSGFDSTLAKPIQNQLFHKTLNQYLNRAKSEEELHLDDLVESLKSGDEFRKLQQNYRDNLPELLNDFKEGLTHQQWPQLQRLAHSVKGAAASMGFEQLTEQAGKIEVLIMQGEYQQASQAILAFIIQCETIINA